MDYEGIFLIYGTELSNKKVTWGVVGGMDGALEKSQGEAGGYVDDMLGTTMTGKYRQTYNTDHTHAKQHCSTRAACKRTNVDFIHHKTADSGLVPSSKQAAVYVERTFTKLYDTIQYRGEDEFSVPISQPPLFATGSCEPGSRVVLKQKITNRETFLI